MIIDDGPIFRSDMSLPASVNPDSQGLHEGALLQAHVVGKLVAEVRRMDVISELL